MNRSRLPLLILGTVAAIAAATSFWQQHRLARLQTELALERSRTSTLPELRNEVARLQQLELDHAELLRLRADRSAMQTELLELRARTSRPESPVGGVLQPPHAGTAQTEEQRREAHERWSEMSRAWGRQAAQREVDRLRERLGLTPEQAEAIHGILHPLLPSPSESVAGTDGSRTNPVRTPLRPSERQARLAALLTPEQMEAYTALRAEDRAESATRSANLALVNLHNLVSLQGDQHEKVFELFYNESLQGMTPNPAEPQPANPTEFMQRRLESRLAALTGVLTPAQLATYREQEEQTLKMSQAAFGRWEALPTPPEP